MTYTLICMYATERKYSSALCSYWWLEAYRRGTGCFAVKVKGKRKAEHLYSALHGIQTALKHSGMDHIV